MIVKLGENKTQIVNNETVDGVMVDVYLYAAAVNTAFVAADFDPNEVQIKVQLKRSKGDLQVIGDNLKLLGIFSAKDYGAPAWMLGNVLTYPAVATKSSKLYSLFIPFGGPINLKGSDELVISFIVGRSVWSTAVDSAISYIDFNYSTCIGYEVGTPFIRSQVVQANITNEKYSLGDVVQKISFINYDKDVIDEGSQVIASLSLQSDKLRGTWNWFQLFSRNLNYFTNAVIQLRYGNTQPVTAGNEALPYVPKYPQSFTIFANKKSTKTLNNVQLNVSYNTANVNASQNFIVWIGAIQDAEIVSKALEMANKHAVENVAKVAEAGTTAAV